MIKQCASLCLLVSLATGCKSGGSGPSMAAKLPGPAESIAATPQTQPSEQSGTSPFSLRRAMQMVGFAVPESGADATLVPNELVQLTSTVNSLVAGAGQLSASDPPHVTAQKAQVLMDSLQPWDAAMTAAQSLGLVDEVSAKPLQLIASRLKVQLEHLIKFGSDPETIAAVKQLAGQLMELLPAGR